MASNNAIRTVACKAGMTLILTGALSVALDNNSTLHDLLQVIYVIGCLMYIAGRKFKTRDI